MRVQGVRRDPLLPCACGPTRWERHHAAIIPHSIAKELGRHVKDAEDEGQGRFDPCLVAHRPHAVIRHHVDDTRSECEGGGARRHMLKLEGACERRGPGRFERMGVAAQMKPEREVGAMALFIRKSLYEASD